MLLPQPLPQHDRHLGRLGGLLPRGSSPFRNVAGALRLSFASCGCSLRSTWCRFPWSEIVDHVEDAVEQVSIPPPLDRRARCIADGLLATPGDSLTLEGWGRRVGASARTLARLFQAETGMGFREYRRQIQIQAAMGMLTGGSAINNVAAELGYESTSAFVHAFRVEAGVTPGQFARAARVVSDG
jgi:AraC-like DNA-binding protein